MVPTHGFGPLVLIDDNDDDDDDDGGDDDDDDDNDVVCCSLVCRFISGWRFGVVVVWFSGEQYWPRL